MTGTLSVEICHTYLIMLLLVVQAFWPSCLVLTLSPNTVGIDEDFSCSESYGLVEFLSEDQRLKKAVHSAISTRLARCKCNV